MLFPCRREMDRAQRASLPCVLLANWQSPPPDMFGGNPRGGLSCGSYDFHHTCAKSPERSSLPILPTTPLPGKGILRLQQIRWAHILSDSSDFRTTECFCQLNSRHLLPFFAEGFFKDNVSQDLTPLKTIASLIP